MFRKAWVGVEKEDPGTVILNKPFPSEVLVDPLFQFVSGLGGV